jgi:hypothetical protein
MDMKKAVLALFSVTAILVVFGTISGRFGYGLVYRESRSINWHFGGLNKVNGKWTCELGEHSSVIGAFWSRYWAEKHYKPEMGYPAPYPKTGLCIDTPSQGEAIATMVTWPVRQNGRCYLADKPNGIENRN